MLSQLLRWWLRPLLGGKRKSAPKPEPELPVPAPVPVPVVPPGLPSPKTVVPLLIFPRLGGNEIFNHVTEIGDSKYYTSSPWQINETAVDEAIRFAEDWMAQALGHRIKWNPVKVVDSQRSLAEWRSGQISLIKDEVERLGFSWSHDYIYLAFVRGMGGYAGSIHYRNDIPGHAMVGDICLEAICGYPVPTAGWCYWETKGGQPTPTALLARLARSYMKRCTGWTSPTPTSGPKKSGHSGKRP